ncbi:hypothetical protein [Pedobacter sp. SL55]|uniref:hypothetical protein n=1 Tax=Pedobacter sp. SL55 TaxID=2995161 RepID=UPI002270D2D9|nr:hypothetical protein [Pedobacter sp. SL55]WAC40204.1 hypothetical protein OVA16_16750 [Pedobacter sp. SL55]
MLKKLKKELSLNIQAALGQKVNQKIVVFESDDWGGIRMPSQEVYQALSKKIPLMQTDRFSKFDALASADDLTALFEVLLKHKDRNGKHPAFTFNVTTGNPDFKQILYHNFERFVVEPFYQTIGSAQPAALPLWHQGLAQGLYQPQYHGREHVNQKRWLASLAKGDVCVREAFNHGTYGFETTFDGAEYLLAAYDYTAPEDEHYWKRSIDQGINIFKDFFGFAPETFIPPCYIAPQTLIDYLNHKGVYGLQGKLYSFFPNGIENGKRKYVKKLRTAGSDSKTGKVNLVRNCFFEPSNGKGNWWVADCLKRMETAFKWGKPAVIDTHRVNYIGNVVESNRTESLQLLNTLLTQILKKWPDVVFMTSDQLARLYKFSDEQRA